MVKEPCPSISGRTPQVHLDQRMLEEKSGKASWRRSSGEGHVSSMSQAREGTSLEGGSARAGGRAGRSMVGRSRWTSPRMPGCRAGMTTQGGCHDSSSLWTLCWEEQP